MATTIVTKYNEREPNPKFDLKTHIENLQYEFERAQGDEDKAGTIDDACFWEGQKTALEWVLSNITVAPEGEE